MTTGNAPADFGPPFDPTDHKVTLKSFLEELSSRFKLAYGDVQYQERRPPIKVPALRVAIVRFKGSDRDTVAAADELKASDYIPARDVLDGKTKDEAIHPGDVIILYDWRWWPSEPTTKPKDASAPGSK